MKVQKYQKQQQIINTNIYNSNNTIYIITQQQQTQKKILTNKLYIQKLCPH